MATCPTSHPHRAIVTIVAGSKTTEDRGWHRKDTEDGGVGVHAPKRGERRRTSDHGYQYYSAYLLQGVH